MAPSDPTCSLADLDGWSFPGTALAVLGHPIKHSISPAMHNAALGLPHANGLAMLVHQGAKALEIWTGVPATTTAPVMATAARAALGLA